ncbi:sensor histidine kinase [Clostridium oryzae]|uniref:Sensor histidine kinase YpdA n=1 Tax=Clostridium oryzae TaxID=1450648 RepID=A0A1V4IEG3_9CLOT|nr:sensor histidine kinase [Clostridium oryzae]OPJ58392.1 sensor histidine kinase YpdA [Clostridium oryzae]
MKRVIAFFKDLNVSWKFVVTYSVILSVQMILTGVYLYIQASNSTIDQARLMMKQNLMQTRESILKKGKVIENAASIITLSDDIQNFLDYKYENETHRIEDYQFKFSPFIGTIIKTNENINCIRIYMKNSVITEKMNSYYSTYKSENYTQYSEIMKEKPKKSGWSSTHLVGVDNNNPENVISFIGTITSKSSYKRIGTVEIQTREDVLFNMLRGQVINKLGKVFIVDSNNKIISNNINGLYKKDVSKVGINNYLWNKELNCIKKIDNKKCILISLPIEQAGYSVVGVFPVNNFNSSVRKSVTYIVLVLLVLALILGIVIYLITNMLLSRVKILAKAMRQVRQGNLNVSVEVKSKDEFGELGLTFNHMTKRIYNLVETVYKIEIMEREAELKALEAQINPHFLYNTLATISWIGRKEKSADVVNITNSLAKFYRLILNKGRTLIKVKEEMDILAAYLSIQKVRFDDAFDVIYDVDEKIYNYEIIKNILQPIVENSLSYGIEPKRGHGTIVIKAWESEDKLWFKIIDDGVGMSKEVLNSVLSWKAKSEKGNGYAIKNIMQRLKAYYGDECSFEIFSRLGIGTEVSITIKKHINLPNR